MREVRRNATQAPLSTGQIGKGQRFDNRPSWRGRGQYYPASQAGWQTHRVPTEGTSAKSATRTNSSTRQFYFQKSGVQLCTHICEMTWVAFFFIQMTRHWRCLGDRFHTHGMPWGRSKDSEPERPGCGRASQRRCKVGAEQLCGRWLTSVLH